MNPVEYDGMFQVIGIGAHAIYPVVTTYSTASTGGSTTVTTTRRLVELTAVAGVLTATLPTTDVRLGAEVKLATATDNATADTLSIVDIAPSPLCEGCSF